MIDKAITSEEAKALRDYIVGENVDEATKTVVNAICDLTRHAKYVRERLAEELEYLARRLNDEAKAVRSPKYIPNSLGIIQGSAVGIDVKSAELDSTLQTLTSLRPVMHAIMGTADRTAKPRPSKPNGNEAKRTCPICNEKIGTSDILYHEGKPAHFDCADASRVAEQPCARCGKVIGAGGLVEQLEENVYAHSRCLLAEIEAQICTCCGEPIGVWRYERDGKGYCHTVCPRDMEKVDERTHA